MKISLTCSHVLCVIFVNVVSRQGNLVPSQHGFSWTNISNVDAVQSLWYELCEFNSVMFILCQHYCVQDGVNNFFLNRLNFHTLTERR